MIRFAVGFVCFSLMATSWATAQESQNWPNWRGPSDNGSVKGGTYPIRWTPDSARWKAKLGGKGCSTPAVWKGVIYVTSPVDGKDSVTAFDKDGKSLWSTSFGQERAGKHRNGSGCNASPTTDGQGVFVYFKSGTLAALNMDGKIRWQTNLVNLYGKDTLFWDHGTSPVLTSKAVIMTRMHKGESWLAAFDKESGKLLWKEARNYQTPVEGDHGYATPLLIKFQGKEALLVWGAEHLTVHSVTDGKVIWTCGGFNPQRKGLWPSIATPVVVGDMVIIAYGRNDRGIPRLHGIKLSGEGDVTETARIWKRDDVGTFVPTPVAHQGNIIVVGDQGKVTCIDPKTGDDVWSSKFPKNRAKFYGSPIVANNHLYAPREDGVIFVAKLGNDFEVVSENKMGESVIASPVAVADQLLIRSINGLFCITAEKQ